VPSTCTHSPLKSSDSTTTETSGLHRPSVRHSGSASDAGADGHTRSTQRSRQFAARCWIDLYGIKARLRRARAASPRVGDPRAPGMRAGARSLRAPPPRGSTAHTAPVSTSHRLGLGVGHFSSFPDKSLHAISDKYRVLVLPGPDHRPARFQEPGVKATITGNVPRDLGRPVVHVRLGRHEVLGAPMPVTAVDEHRDLGPREHNVSRIADALEGLVAHAETQPT